MMARRGDGIYLRRCVLVLLLVAAVATPAAGGGLDRASWLKLYDSPVTLAKYGAIAYVSGMANGLTIAEAIDCAGLELSGEQIAATVAAMVRNSEVEIKVAVPLSLIILKGKPAPNSIFDRARR
jgi:hypothetical protein